MLPEGGAYLNTQLSSPLSVGTPVDSREEAGLCPHPSSLCSCLITIFKQFPVLFPPSHLLGSISPDTDLAALPPTPWLLQQPRLLHCPWFVEQLE